MKKEMEVVQDALNIILGFLGFDPISFFQAKLIFSCSLDLNVL